MKTCETYVRPLLEYSVCVWSLYQLEDVTKIESIERRFTKRLSGLSNVSYVGKNVIYVYILWSKA